MIQVEIATSNRAGINPALVPDHVQQYIGKSLLDCVQAKIREDPGIREHWRQVCAEFDRRRAERTAQTANG